MTILVQLNILRRGVNILRQEGIVEFVRQVLGFLRRNLRHGLATLYGRYLVMLPFFYHPKYNGISISKPHLPWDDSERPTYESGLISAIQNHVDLGNDVVIVGGGYGVTAVEAGNQVGNDGSVVVYEGSPMWARRAEETVRLNECENVASVQQAVVGPNINVYDGGTTEDVETLPPDSLPQCDVLELDCEGAELDILRELNHRPKKIFVESHGMHGAPSSKVREILEDMSYDVISTTVADDSKRDSCQDNDVLVLVALKDDTG